MVKVGVVVMGTNSTRLLIGEVKNCLTVKSLSADLAVTRLGENIESGRLLPSAIERTLKVVGEYVKQIKRHRAEKIMIAATCAVRDAANKQELLSKVKVLYGIEAIVLSGEEEAFLTYSGVLNGLGIETEGAAVVDIGGGSTEFVWTVGGKTFCRSVNVGAVRMTEGKYCPGKTRRLLDPVLSDVRSFPPRVLVGVGGTITTLAAMALRIKRYQPRLTHGYYLSSKQVDNILFKLESLGPEDIKKLPGLMPERTDIITAGTRIVREVLNGLGMSSIIVSETDIMQGIALHAAGFVEIKQPPQY